MAKISGIKHNIFEWKLFTLENRPTFENFQDPKKYKCLSSECHFIQKVYEFIIMTISLASKRLNHISFHL